MPKYVKTLEEVEAVQAKENNIEELRKIAPGIQQFKKKGTSATFYTIPGFIPCIWAGSWLIKHESGRLEVKGSQLFFREYEPK